VAEPEIADRLKACGQVALATSLPDDITKQREPSTCGYPRWRPAWPPCWDRASSSTSLPTPAPQQDPDFTVGRRDLEDATLRGDFAVAQSAAAGFARHLFSSLPPVTVEGLRPLR
jgi:hypothetical protein